MSTINGHYTKVSTTKPEPKNRNEIRGDMIIICAIYGVPLILGWGVSVMGGVKFSPYLALMAVPVFGSLAVAGIINIVSI